MDLVTDSIKHSYDGTMFEIGRKKNSEELYLKLCTEVFDIQNLTFRLNGDIFINDTLIGAKDVIVKISTQCTYYHYYKVYFSFNDQDYFLDLRLQIYYMSSALPSIIDKFYPGYLDSLEFPPTDEFIPVYYPYTPSWNGPIAVFSTRFSWMKMIVAEENYALPLLKECCMDEDMWREHLHNYVETLTTDSRAINIYFMVPEGLYYKKISTPTGIISSLEMMKHIVEMYEHVNKHYFELDSRYLAQVYGSDDKYIVNYIG